MSAVALQQALVVVAMLAASFAEAALAILDPVDFLALQSIRKSLDDVEGSRFFSEWDFTGDPCGFPGVTCSGDRVTVLALGDPSAGSPGLTGRIDPSIGQLSQLVEFSLVPGRVFGEIPDSIALCSGLRFLAFSNNFLSGEIPAAIGSLWQLRTLDLSYNILSGSIPPSIPSLPELTNLILCHNRLTGEIPAALPDSSGQLLRLDLKNNGLSGEIPPLPPSLQYLSLSSNRLGGRVDRVLPRLNRLNYLDLGSNQLAGPVPSPVFSFPLEALRLQRNNFSGPVRPAGPVQIGLVDLSYNRLWGALPAELSAVGSLYLNNNRFTGVVPASMVERLLGAGMQVLYLQHNFLTGIEISPAADIPVSTSLCLQYNCMVPPVAAPCPLRAGSQKTRPLDQCPEWQG